MDGLEAMRRVRRAERKLNEKCELLGVSPLVRSSDSLLDRRESPPPHLNHNSSLSVDSTQTRRSLHLDRSAYREGGEDFGFRQVIIGVSANSDTDTMEEALLAGADAFISKPFSVDSFYHTVNKCWSLQRKWCNKWAVRSSHFMTAAMVHMSWMVMIIYLSVCLWVEYIYCSVFLIFLFMIFLLGE